MNWVQLDALEHQAIPVRLALWVTPVLPGQQVQPASLGRVEWPVHRGSPEVLEQLVILDSQERRVQRERLELLALPELQAPVELQEQLVGGVQC